MIVMWMSSPRQSTRRLLRLLGKPWPIVVLAVDKQCHFIASQFAPTEIQGVSCHESSWIRDEEFLRIMGVELLNF